MSEWKSIALDATDELRRQMCRRGPHEMVPKAMLDCPRCSAILRFEAAVKREEAECAIVQTPETAAADAEQVKEAIRQAADRPGERHD